MQDRNHAEARKAIDEAAKANRMVWQGSAAPSPFGTFQVHRYQPEPVRLATTAASRPISRSRCQKREAKTRLEEILLNARQ